MSRFRKRPVVIDAYRIGTQPWPGAIWQGVTDAKIYLHPGYVEIDTLEGVMRGNEGDWIIKGVNGEFYPCKNDIFEKTYEAVIE